MEEGAGSWTREPLHRPFVAWNQVDAICVAMRVPIEENGCFLPLLYFGEIGTAAVA
jgi:hypothetical protein